MQPCEIQLHSSFVIISLTCSCVNLVKRLNPLLLKIVCHVKVVTVINLLRGIVSTRIDIQFFKLFLEAAVAREKQINLQMI